MLSARSQCFSLTLITSKFHLKSNLITIRDENKLDANFEFQISMKSITCWSENGDFESVPYIDISDYEFFLYSIQINGSNVFRWLLVVDVSSKHVWNVICLDESEIKEKRNKNFKLMWFKCQVKLIVHVFLEWYNFTSWYVLSLYSCFPSAIFLFPFSSCSHAHAHIRPTS